MDFATMMQLQPEGDDVYVCTGPNYPWGGLYGGQIVAQGLRAAAATVDERFRVHSLPDVPPPEALTGESWSPMFERRFAGERNQDVGKAIAWMRLVDEIGDDAVLHACALAYLSDDVPTDTVVALHPERPAPGMGDAYEYGFMSASLDHAIWFHRPHIADAWHVHDFTSHAYLSSRGLAVGHVLTREGVHVATVAQEVLLRKT